MLPAVLPAKAPCKPRCRSMLLHWRTARLSVIDQRCCCVQRSTANVIYIQIAVCAGSPSEPEHRSPASHWHFPHKVQPRGFVQSGFCEVARTSAAARFVVPRDLTEPSRFPNQFFNDSWVVGFWRADHGGNEIKLGRRSWTLAQTVLGSLGSQGAAADVSALCGWADRAG